jgi:hypothetical protein
MPCPAEHQPLVRHDLAIDAADLVVSALGFEADAVAAADAQIEIGPDRAFLDRTGTEPLH